MATVKHTFLAGTSVNWTKSLFFDLMKTGDAYLGFARETPQWGFSSLLKINHTKTYPTDVMGQANSGIPDASSDEKFYDSLSSTYLQAGEIPSDGGNAVYIAYIDKNFDTSVRSNFNFLNSNDIGTLTLEYMNGEWAKIRGLDEDFLEQVMAQFLVTSYDYYLFSHTQHEDSLTKIEVIDDVILPEITFPVKLMYSTVVGAVVPTTAFGNNQIGNLIKSVDVLGQTTITGVDTDFVTSGNGYIVDNNLTAATFFLTTAAGVVIQDNIDYVDIVETDEEISMVFSYPLEGESIQNSGRFKISNTINPQKLAVFNESIFGGTTINDLNPPPLPTNYLKMGMIHSSIFDVLGLERLESADIDFARRIDNTETETQLSSVQGIDIESDIDLITIDDNPDTTVKYAITSDTSIARQYYFDLVRIKKTLDQSTPTDKIYRQLFICYNPKSSIDGALDISTTSFTHTDLFQIDNHTYDLGTILYVANKTPVWREHLSQSEDFTLLI